MNTGGPDDGERRFFTSYAGGAPPPRLVGAIASESLSNRNTYIRANFDRAGALEGFDKLVYGEVELAHRYEYHRNGALKRACILAPDENAVWLDFDLAGIRIRNV